MCTCGDRIKSPILRSIKCETKCPGDEKEICGGDDSLSLRRTGCMYFFIFHKVVIFKNKIKFYLA